MKDTTKYLKLMLLSAFLAAQVQYASVSHFCTMIGETVNSTVCSQQAEENSCPCGQDRSSATSTHEGPALASNCMQVRVEKKSVIDTFTGPQKSILHFVGFTCNLNQQVAAIYQSATFSCGVSASIGPPVLDLLTINNSLRI